MDIYGRCSVFFDDEPVLSNDAGSDEQDLNVWFGTERFYTTNSYYAEAIDYGSRALKLVEGGKLKHTKPTVRNTLLCDK